MNTVPKKYTVSDRMMTDLLYDPAMAAWVFFRLRLDAFQRVRLKAMWLTPDFEDSSGAGSGKTIVDWCCVNLSAILIPDCHIGVIYQTFDAGKRNFWKYYREISTPIFRAQIGQIDERGEEAEGVKKDPGCYIVYFKNKSQVMMPAPSFMQEAKNIGGLDLNRILIDEWTKVVSSGSGMAGVTKQIMTRRRRHSWNKNHPVWCNKLWLTATAELGNHPAYPMHQRHLKEIKKGNPDYGYLSFCYKHYSNLTCATGKSFRDEYRDEKGVRKVINANPAEKVRAEIYGMWAKMLRGWFTEQMIQGCRELGRERKLTPVISRAADALGKSAFYFLGLDSQISGRRSTADQGALVVMRATASLPESADNEWEYDRDYVYSRVVKGYDAEAYGGMIHELHQDFGFSVIVIDTGGGGFWVISQLRKTTQTIGGARVKVKPLVLRSAPSIEGDLAVVPLLRSDEEIRKLWPELKHARGDDVLKDYAYTLFQTSMAKGGIALPPPHWERKQEEMIGWPAAKVWSSKLLTQMGLQAMNLSAELKEDGTWKLTGNGSRIFVCTKGKDDILDAGRNAYVGFRIWLLTREMDINLGQGQAAFFAGASGKRRTPAVK